MKASIEKYIPIIKEIKNYSSDKFKKDLISGLTVGVMLIPQGMAYALIAGVPPIYGLYGGLVPLFIYPLLGTSRHISIGPVALDMLILATAIGTLAGNSVEEKVALVLMITVLTGLLQLLMGALKLGIAFNLFSRPVISGFTIAAPVIIISSQISTLVNLDAPQSQNIFEILVFLTDNLEKIHFPSLITSLFFILFLVIQKRFFSRVPGSIVLVILAICFFYFVDPARFGLSQIGLIPKGLPGFQFSGFSFEQARLILPHALTLALIQFMTVASLSKTFARKHGYTVDPNQELIAVGSSNVIGGFFQSLPVSSSFSRSAIAEQSGTETSLNNLFAGILILLTLLLFTSIFEVLPNTLLGAIIVVSVSSLIDVKEIKFLINTKRRDGIVAFLTFASVLLIGIQEGIIIGIISSVSALLLKLGKPTVAELGLIPGTRDFKNINRFTEARIIPGILILRVDASFSFINADFFKNYILEKTASKDKAPEFVILDGTTISDLDVSAIESLIMIIETLNKHGIELFLSGLIGPVRDIISKSNIKVLKKKERFFRTVHDAVKKALEKQDSSDKGTRLFDYSELSA